MELYLQTAGVLQKKDKMQSSDGAWGTGFAITQLLLYTDLNGTFMSSIAEESTQTPAVMQHSFPFPITRLAPTWLFIFSC